jgi:hypothetical protein
MRRVRHARSAAGDHSRRQLEMRFDERRHAEACTFVRIVKAEECAPLARMGRRLGLGYVR